MPSVIRGSRVLNDHVDTHFSVSNSVNNESNIPFPSVGVLLCCTYGYLTVWTPCLLTNLIITTHLLLFLLRNVCQTDACDRAVEGVGLRPLACLHCGFEPRQRHGYLPLMSIVCCQVVVSALGWSLFPEEPYRVWCVWVWSWGDPGPLGAVTPYGGKKVYQRGNQLTSISCILYYVGRHSVFGTVTSYGLDVPGIESPCGRYLPHLSRPVLGLTHLSIRWVPVHTPEVKRPGCGDDHLPHLEAKLKKL